MYLENNSYQISWGKIATIEAAAETAEPPLITFHGWLDNAASFIPLMNELPEFYWISTDLAGHGHSDKRPGGNVRHFLSYVQDTWELMDILGYEKYNLVGHSLGSGIASIIAATWPHRINKMVLIDGMGPFSNEEHDLVNTLAQSFDDLKKHLRSPVNTRTDISFENLEDATEYLLKRRRWPIAKSSATLLAERQLMSHEDRLVWNYDELLKLTSALPFNHRQVNEIYSKIEAPTLLTRFSSGPMHLAHIPWQERIDAMKSLSIVDVPGDHHLHMDDAGAIAPLIRNFLMSQPSN